VTRALVRFRSDKSLRWPDSAQFYEVDGWHPIGPRYARATLAADIWLPAPDGSAWLGTRDGARFGLYEVPSLKPRWQLQLPETSVVRAWQFSHDGNFLAIGSVDGAVRLVDAAHGNAIALGSTPGVRVLRVEFSADDHTLAALDENGQLWIWDVGTRLPRAAPLNFVRIGSDASLIRFAGDTLFGGAIFNSGSAELAMPRWRRARPSTTKPWPAPYDCAATCSVPLSMLPQRRADWSRPAAKTS
jgi:WD40 repeat protein